MNWSSHKVLVTGGASFIGSHLVGALVERGAAIRVINDLSSGKISNIQTHIDGKRIEFIKADLTKPGIADTAVNNIDYVFPSGCSARRKGVCRSASGILCNKSHVGRHTFPSML